MDFAAAVKKAKIIVEQMTVEEKMSQLVYNSPAIERLGINEYNWWNEAAHGVARAGVATVFPQAIGMAATFNPLLVNMVADAVSTEARAKYNKSVQFNDYDIYKGLTFWTPNINIFRDPHWGRGQETFGEDPFLTATMGVSYIKGLQGDGDFLKSAACAKHFAVHSGPEKERHHFNAIVSEKDLCETYLPAFEYAVKKANVAGVMGAYNCTNGQPCCANTKLMEILRQLWGFNGYFVSDCGAIADISENHRFTNTMTEAAALALKSGCDLNCGEAYAKLVDAYEEDLITEEDITDAVVRLYTIRALLGEFEEDRPFADIPYSKLDCKQHRELNLESAKQSLVLLKNESGYLPLSTCNVKKIAVIGPNSMSRIALEGNYNGHASEYVTVADGIRSVFADSKVIVADGSHLYANRKSSWGGFEYLHSEGLAAASEAEVTVLCLGLDRTIEGEEMWGIDENFSVGGDRQSLYLPKTQMDLAESVCDVCENVVVVVMCGSAIDLGEKITKHAKAIIHAWYPGALGGLAVAHLISGKYSPSGKLPVTFYKADNKIPKITDYSMSNRTYRYINEQPLYPFGYGLGFSEFCYDDFKLVSADEGRILVEIKITNIGSIKATEKVQIYAEYTDSRTKTPNFQLCAVSAVDIEPKETKSVTAEIDRYWLKAVLEDGTRVDPDRDVILHVGGHQPDRLSTELSGYACKSLKI